MFAKIKTFRKYSTKKVDSVKYLFISHKTTTAIILLSSVCKGNVLVLTNFNIKTVKY